MSAAFRLFSGWNQALVELSHAPQAVQTRAVLASSAVFSVAGYATWATFAKNSGYSFQTTHI